MRTPLVILVILLLLAIVFAFQNPGLTEIQFGVWSGEASTALIILITLATGLLIGILAMMPSTIRRNREIRKLNRTINDLASSPSETRDEKMESSEAGAPGSSTGKSAG